MEFSLDDYKRMVQTKTDYEILNSHVDMQFDIFPAMRYDRDSDELETMQDLSYHVIAFKDGSYVNCLDVK